MLQIPQGAAVWKTLSCREQAARLKCLSGRVRYSKLEGGRNSAS